MDVVAKIVVEILDMGHLEGFLLGGEELVEGVVAGGSEGKGEGPALLSVPLLTGGVSLLEVQVRPLPKKQVHMFLCELTFCEELRDVLEVEVGGEHLEGRILLVGQKLLIHRVASSQRLILVEVRALPILCLLPEVEVYPIFVLLRTH